MTRIISIGIDLGTTNSAVALCQDKDSGPEVLDILQCWAAHKAQSDRLLPSFCYLPLEAERAQGALALPWEERPGAVCGHYARIRSGEAPNRTIVSAKSWLCNAYAPRREKILPWKSEGDIDKMSPVECSALYIGHLKNVMRERFEEDLEQPEVIITVPASFDEVARGLTHEAAEMAGIRRAVLVEEPLAAFYAWISANKTRWREEISAGDLILICDVGGGTSDFSFISVREERGQLQLDRVSVGEHILLGGDNMDLALAVRLREKLESLGKKLDRWQFMSLVQSARRAKEELFETETKASIQISIAGRGSSLLASSLTVELSQSLLREVVLEGFFPEGEAGERPAAKSRAGLQELGLPFAADPAITRHLAEFLKKSLDTVRASAALSSIVGSLERHESAGFLVPSKVLFNGGVFKAAGMRAQVVGLLSKWSGRQVEELGGAEYELGVAKGAAVYGRIRRTGTGLRISTKTLKSYYLGIESSMPAVPGYVPPLMGLCVVPQGLEEGSVVELPSRQFGLTTGQPAEFRFFSSEMRAQDAPGSMVEDAEAELEETSSLSITVPSIEGRQEIVPVRLSAHVNEMGILELWMQHVHSEKRWKLEFRVRAED